MTDREEGSTISQDTEGWCTVDCKVGCGWVVSLSTGVEGFLELLHTYIYVAKSVCQLGVESV